MSNDETELLRDVVRDVLAAAVDAQAIEGVERDGGVPPLWATLASLEWPMIGVPGTSSDDAEALEQLAVVLSGVGRHAAPVPLAETCLARWALGERNAELEADAVATVAPARIQDHLRLERRRTEVVLSGSAERVPWANQATAVLAYAGDGDVESAVLVPQGAAGVRIAPGRNLAGEPRDLVSFADVAVPLSALVEHAATRHEVTLRAALGRAAAIVGALEATYELTREHVMHRRQFDRPLIRLQVVGAHLARMAIELALARAALEGAVDTTQSTRADVVAATAAARVTTARAATTIARLAHQLHGAIGVTREHSLQLWTRRLWSWRDEGGSQADWAARLGRDLIARGPEEMWAFITG
jgi:alkylation response protein AidB-like acyl-CoA dehydrogenase